jgi:phospholipase/carboxylesterase
MSKWGTRRTHLGSLDCQVVERGSAAEIAVLLCHGYGAPGDDLVSLAEVFIDYLGEAADRLRFIFPIAPMQPPELAPYGGRAWWAINMAALLAANQASAFSQLHDKTPPGIDSATQMLQSCVQAALDELADGGRYVLGGFSQGAMLTMNTALMSTLPPPEVLVQFSGTLICQTQWKQALDQGRLSQSDVIQSHGRQDPILPCRTPRTSH